MDKELEIENEDLELSDDIDNETLVAERLDEDELEELNQKDDSSHDGFSSNDNIATNFGVAAAIASTTINSLNKDIFNHDDNQDINFNDNHANVKNFKFDYNKITTNPIEMFYDHFNKTFSDIITDYYSIEFKNNKVQLDKIKNLTEDIDDTKASIIKKKSEVKYSKRMFMHYLYIISFFLIIGLFFIGQFKENYAQIKSFREFRNMQLNNIDNFKASRFSLIVPAISPINLNSIIKYCLSRYGIKTSELIPAKEIIKFMNNEDILDVRSGIFGLYKNSPFYDVIVRQLNFSNVVTSRSKSFPYIAQESYVDSNGNWRTRSVTRFETLTAYHHENTPFINSDNVLFYGTNFEPDLKFNISKSNHKNKNIILENKEFLKNYKIDVLGLDDKNSLAISQKLSQFFTLKAQEDYLAWYIKNSGDIFDFYKIRNLFVVENKEMSYNSLSSQYSFIKDNNLISVNQDDNLNDVLFRISTQANFYLDKLFKMVQLPLLSPTINREWYKFNSKSYYTSNMVSLEEEDINSESKVDYLYMINRFLSSQYLWFNIDKSPRKEIWLDLESSKKGKHNIYHLDYHMNSYYSERLIDYVTVVGIHVGAKIIAVPYERFYHFNEKKYLAHLFVINNKTPKFIVNKVTNQKLNVDAYSNADIAKKVHENGIWTNNPTWLDKYEKRSNLINFFETFNKLNQDNQASLIVDEYGIYILSNMSSTNVGELETLMQSIYKLII